MRIRIGIENGIEGRSLAWFLDFPGCFAYGSDGSQAVLRSPQALLRYKEWVDSHTADAWTSDLQDFDIHLEETFNVYTFNPADKPDARDYEVNAWFRDDERPLEAEELRRGLLVLEWSRTDLLDLVASLSPLQLDREFPGERWSIRGVLRHVANTEHWYLDRLGLAGQARQELPEDVFERLLTVRTRFFEVLPTLQGMKEVREVTSESWSPRKLLRRAAWHEIDHIEHIFKLITLL